MRLDLVAARAVVVVAVGLFAQRELLRLLLAFQGHLVCGQGRHRVEGRDFVVLFRTVLLLSSRNNFLPLFADLAVLDRRDTLLDSLHKEISLSAFHDLQRLLNHVVSKAILDQVGQPFAVDQLHHVLGADVVRRPFKAVLKHGR